MTKILVCGGRRFHDSEAVSTALNEHHPTIVIHGGCGTGADAHAYAWARWNNVKQWIFRADWSLGRKAGPLRNQDMLDTAKPDLVLAFPGGRGTADMVRRAKAAGVTVIEIERPDDEAGS